MILLERDGALAVATLARPPVNAIDDELLSRLEAVMEGIAGASVLLLRSSEKAFCAGADLELMRSRFDTDEGRARMVALARGMQRAFARLERLAQVTIAEIGGAAMGGGLELALACDLRYAASTATMAMPEALWGGFPGAGAPLRLPLLVGKARALELICTGREIDAAEMERLGIVQGVFPQDRLLAEAKSLASRIAASGPLAVRGAKRIMAARQEPGFRAARELSDALRSALEWSQDVDEGIAAHRENRKPKFTGR
jgi:enoyl-CoA hydratase/carnithine racemase